MNARDLSEAFEATWPAAEYADAGGFRVGRGLGGGGRVSSARRIGAWTETDIDVAIAIQRGWNQPPMFRLDDDDAQIIAALKARGFERTTPTAIMALPVAALTDLDVPQVTAFSVWPPLAIQRDIWSAGNVGSGRQAVMDRVTGPRAALLGRIKDRAAGAGFVAVHGNVAMIHAIEVLPEWRRLGLAGWMMREAASWAGDNGALTLALAVSRANASAVALYEKQGFSETTGYAYYQ